MRFSPCVDRAWNDVASKSTSGNGPVDLVVIQQLLTDDKKIVIALCPICAACTAPEKDDSARMQLFHEAVYRLGKFDIFYRSLPHMSLISVPASESNEPIRNGGSGDGPGRNSNLQPDRCERVAAGSRRDGSLSIRGSEACPLVISAGANGYWIARLRGR